MLSEKRKPKNQEGQIIIFAVIFMLLMLIASGSLVGYAHLNLQGVRKEYWNKQALYLAQAGFEKAIYQLNKNSNYNGENNTSLGDGEFTVTVTTIDSSTRQITSTGYIPNSTNPKAIETITAVATINKDIINFNYGIQVGAGGLSMDNNALVAGNVFSNGNVQGLPGSTITGDVDVAAGTALTADQEWTVQDADFAFGKNSQTANVAQGFTPSVGGNLNSIKVFLKKTALPSNITVRVLSDENGMPSKNVLGTGSIPASSVAGSYGFIDVSLSNNPTLSAGIKYWLMLSTPSNSSNYFFWGGDSAAGYPSGQGMRSSNWNAANPVWTDIGGDLDFQVFIGGFETFLNGVTVNGDAYAARLENCQIAGNAFYETVNTCTVGGNDTPNSPPHPPQSMPISDAEIQAWKTAATNGGVVTGDQIVNASATLGPLEIDGNLTVKIGATLTLLGPLWVKGNVYLENNSTIQVDASLGNGSIAVVADNPSDPSGSGTISVLNNVIVNGNGNPNSFVLLLSTNTGGDAIMVNNNAIAAIYYASRGTVHVFNNSGGNQITGFAIKMENNSSITYDAGLQNTIFSNGPGGSWVYAPGTYAIKN